MSRKPIAEMTPEEQQALLSKMNKDATESQNKLIQLQTIDTQLTNQITEIQKELVAEFGTDDPIKLEELKNKAIVEAEAALQELEKLLAQASQPSPVLSTQS